MVSLVKLFTIAYMSQYIVPLLPLSVEIETRAVLKKAISANRALAQLKGIALSIPNQAILINTLSIQESKDSSEIENIVTTHDQLFQSHEGDISMATKEVAKYTHAISYGYSQLKKKGVITNNLITEMGEILTPSIQSFRKVAGTDLRNPATKELVYTPPQENEEIEKLMKNLELFINDEGISTMDPLIKMAIIHHQFESIHPFHDGNGRSGRIINILYLISQNILDTPILYLSRFIIENKSEYYELLQRVRDEGAWEEWVLYMLDGLEYTALLTIESIKQIRFLLTEYKSLIKAEAESIYSHELLNTIFSHPYTKIEYIVSATGVSRQTASKYLKQLVDLNILTLKKHKNTNYYINERLVDIFEKL